MAPLSGLRVVDFSTLLPGPLASLILAESGAEVVKIERPGQGDESRALSPALFAMLNRGKRSFALDLSSAQGRQTALSLMEGADVVIEQFRPGVMDRLGLGWEAAKAINPRLVYCSITGYGQSGPLAAAAGHDLNYQAEAGLLDLCPGLPHILAADIMGGAYPAVLNILLALERRQREGSGCHLDVAMAENVLPNLLMDLAAQAEGMEKAPLDKGFFLGASPRYRYYETRDGRRMAVGAVENRFWNRLCELMDLPAPLRDDRQDPAATAQALAHRFASHDAAHWETLFDGQDVCCNRVNSPGEAMGSAHFNERGVFSRFVGMSGLAVPAPAIPLPLAPALRHSETIRSAPALGEDTRHDWSGNV
jgi:crotonobetainyl-CoA:carnitine CoA-transferase CaiB-like acyl-CoA transferase